MHVLHLLSITLHQNIANTLFDTIGEIKGPLLYCFRFEVILNSWLLSFAIILMGKNELVAFFSLSSLCLVIVVWLFLTVPWACMQFVIVVFIVVFCRMTSKLYPTLL